LIYIRRGQGRDLLGIAEGLPDPDSDVLEDFGDRGRIEAMRASHRTDPIGTAGEQPIQPGGGIVGGDGHRIVSYDAKGRPTIRARLVARFIAAGQVQV
jgi:hypothetical protein